MTSPGVPLQNRRHEQQARQTLETGRAVTIWRRTRPTTTQGSTITASETKTKLPRLKRTQEQELPPFQRTFRDNEIVRAVYEYRCLTSKQVETLFFTPAKPRRNNGAPAINSRCLNRLKLLSRYHLLFRDEQPQKLSEGRKPRVYWLGEQGAVLVASMLGCKVGDLDRSRQDCAVSWQGLEHLIATNGVRVAMNVAARAMGWSIAEWLDERDLKRLHHHDRVTITVKQGRPIETVVIPDGFVRLYDGVKYSYRMFLEIDRATETVVSSKGQKDWQRKIAAYLAYYESKKYQERYHTNNMRVLTITTSDARLQNLKAATEAVGGQHRFWFTTFDRIMPASVLVQPIWQVASKPERHALVAK